MTEQELEQLKIVLTAQSNILEKLTAEVDDIETKLNDVNNQTKQIDELNKIMDGIEEDVDYLTYKDVANLSLDDIDKIYTSVNQKIAKEYQKLNFNNWDDFVNETFNYCLKNDLNTLLPYEALLSEEDIQKIKAEEHELKKYKWDEWDYFMVGITGIIAIIIDVFVVRIPETMTTGKYAGQKGSDITKWLKSLKLPPQFQSFLENYAKVPYDRTGGADHRINTYGHDPVLGLFWGVWNIWKNKSTSFDKESGIITEPKGEQHQIKLLEAILKQLAHLLSDVATTKGLPVPFATFFRILKFGSFTGVNGKKRTISDIALWMYHNGYDLRHFITMGIVPGTIEIILRAYFMIRIYNETGESTLKTSSTPKYRTMLLIAHSIACAGNACKIIFQGNNPLAFNYAEWLALTRYLIPTIKHWVFDDKKIKLTDLNKIEEKEWEELLSNSKYLLERSYAENLPEIYLGNQEHD